MPLLSKTIKKTVTTIVEENGKTTKTTVETVSEGDGELRVELMKAKYTIEVEASRLSKLFYKGLGHVWNSANKIVQSLTEQNK